MKETENKKTDKEDTALLDQVDQQLLKKLLDSLIVEQDFIEQGTPSE